MRCLGHHLAASSNIAVDWHEAVRKIWAAFWANFCEGLRKASWKAQRRFMSTSLKTIAGFRWSRWPWQRSYADRLDRLQRVLLNRMRPIIANPGESFEGFRRRRTAICSQRARECGCWSELWRQDVINWDAHIDRARDPGRCTKLVRDWHGHGRLNERRFEHHYGDHWNKTGTRAVQGHPATRWSEGVLQARANLQNT